MTDKMVEGLFKHTSMLRKNFKYAFYVARCRSFSRSVVKEKLWSEYLRNPPELVRTNEGFYLYLNPTDKHISFQIAVTGEYNDIGDRFVNRLFKKLLKSSSLVVDVGANIGWYTFLAAKNARRVVAFEPELQNLSFLRKSRKRNSADNVEILNYALSDRVGPVALSVSTKPGHHSIVRDVGAQVLVQSTTLDEAFSTETIDLLKIDVEGAEPLVIKGASRLISEGRIKVIIMEWNPEVWSSTRLLEGFEMLTTDGRVLGEPPPRKCNLYLRNKTLPSDGK